MAAGDGEVAVPAAEKPEEDQVVNPWEVSAKEGGKIDYDKLIVQFGCQRLDQSIIDRVHRLTSRSPHVFLRRGVFFAHRYSLSLSTYACMRLMRLCVYNWQGFQ